MLFRSIFLFLLSALYLSTSTRAQTGDFERVLLPIVVADEVPGAFGSRWTTRLAVTNTAAAGVTVFGYDAGCITVILAICSFGGTTPPSTTFFPVVHSGSSSQGAIMLVERSYAPSIIFQLRVQDVSRQSQTWGTEIPVVRESKLLRSSFDLLDIPLTSEFRSTLRLYDVDAHSDAQALLRFYRVYPATRIPFGDTGPAQADTLLTERTIALSVEHRPMGPSYDLGYAEISNLDAIPELLGTDRLRIEVKPITPNLRLWAFVSVTNNVTQHVTTITPQ